MPIGMLSMKGERKIMDEVECKSSHKCGNVGTDTMDGIWCCDYCSWFIEYGIGQ
jgi:ribosomal protein L37AE/L43A